MSEIVTKEGEVKKLVVSHLKERGYEVEASHPLPIGCWSRSPDIFARKNVHACIVPVEMIPTIDVELRRMED